MAYVSKEKKAKIVAAAKKIIPTGWKVTFSVDNHSEIVATISRAPKYVLRDCIGVNAENRDRLHVNGYHLDKCFKGRTLKALLKLNDALNTDNFNKSDPMSDYHHVGHYITIQFGKYDKPCQFE